MILSYRLRVFTPAAVYQRGWMIDSQHDEDDLNPGVSISKGMDD